MKLNASSENCVRSVAQVFDEMLRVNSFPKANFNDFWSWNSLGLVSSTQFEEFSLEKRILCKVFPPFCLLLHQNTYCVQLCKQSGRGRGCRLLQLEFMHAVWMENRQRGVKTEIEPEINFIDVCPFPSTQIAFQLSITTLCTGRRWRNFIVWLQFFKSLF